MKSQVEENLKKHETSWWKKWWFLGWGYFSLVTLHPCILQKANEGTFAKAGKTEKKLKWLLSFLKTFGRKLKQPKNPSMLTLLIVRRQSFV